MITEISFLQKCVRVVHGQGGVLSEHRPRDRRRSVLNLSNSGTMIANIVCEKRQMETRVCSGVASLLRNCRMRFVVDF